MSNNNASGSQGEASEQPHAQSLGSDGQICIATFNFGHRNRVTNTTKLANAQRQMEQLLENNDIVCLQEADGIRETLRAVAEDKGF